MDAGLVIARLERVPGLRIASLLIPGEVDGLLESVLGRPVHSRIVPGLSPDRRAVVACPNRDALVEAVVAQLVARGYRVESETSVLRSSEGRIDSDLVSPLNLLLSRRWGGAREWAFRVRDLVLAVPALLVLSPVFALVALSIRLDSRGPVFYRQRRLGAGGRPFQVLKFRTMRRDAEVSGPRWASENDPRVTRVGRWLRRWRIDELPQLWNVLVGQMSLVGPRPERAHFSRKLRGDIPMFELRTALRPGLTGWAQVRSSYASGAEEARVKLDHDLYYYTRRSLWFDLAILFETVRVALSGSGSR
jgi:exopolysaccharide biosynthesis polyprenyl glycosylphosphotransferase